MSSEGEAFPPLVATLASTRKRTFAMFAASQAHLAPEFAKERVSAKVLGDYRSSVIPRAVPLVNPMLKGGGHTPNLLTDGGAPLLLLTGGETGSGSAAGGGAAAAAAAAPPVAAVLGSDGGGSVAGGAAAAVSAVVDALACRKAPSGIAAGASQEEFRRVQEIAALAQSESRAVALRKAPPKVPQPRWHAPWKLHRVISGHQGWVRALAVEPGNQWFASGAADRTIKVWDLASGTLKLTLTGHINAVRGIAVSPRHPYMFTCGEDKMVKCWDLETNKVRAALTGEFTKRYKHTHTPLTPPIPPPFTPHPPR
jgi:WD40 repeat protein